MIYIYMIYIYIRVIYSIISKSLGLHLDLRTIYISCSLPVSSYSALLSDPIDTLMYVAVGQLRDQSSVSLVTNLYHVHRKLRSSVSADSCQPR